MFERLLIPVDFSDQSFQMLDCMVNLCQDNDQRLVVLHVTDRGEVTPDQTRQIEDMLESARTRCADARFIVERGDPVEIINRTAEREETTLIAMASSGKGMAREFIVGSTSLGVIRSSKVPVLIDKFQVLEEGGKVKVSKSCVDILRSAIVPLDFTSCDRSVLDVVDSLIDWGIKQAVLFHVVDSSRYRLSDDARFLRVKEKLRAIEKEIDANECELIPHIHFGSLVYNILEVTREFSSTLIVMGTRGKSLLREMTLGSVSEEVIRKARVSLLVVPCAR